MRILRDELDYESQRNEKERLLPCVLEKEEQFEEKLEDPKF